MSVSSYTRVDGAIAVSVQTSSSPILAIADNTAQELPPLRIFETELEQAFADFCALSIDGKALIDHTGLLHEAIDQSIAITPAVIQAVQSFLQRELPLVIAGQADLSIMQFLLLEKECALKQKQPINAFKIVGSLSVHLLLEAVEELFVTRLGAAAAQILQRPEVRSNLTKVPNDWDVRSETPAATLAQLENRLVAVAKQALTFEYGANPAPFDKIYRSKEGKYILIGSGKFDYCLGQVFARSHLFSNSNVWLILQPEMLVPDGQEIAITVKSEGEKGLQVFFDRAFKRLRVAAPEQINYRGAIAWLSALVLGYIPVTFAPYGVLLGTLLKKYELCDGWGVYEGWGGCMAHLLHHTAMAHHCNEEGAKVALALQLELSNAAVPCRDFADGYQELLGRRLWAKLFTEPPAQEPLVALRVRQHLSGQQLSAIMQVGALLALGLPRGCASSAYQIEPKSINGQLAIRYTLQQKYHLLVALEPLTLANSLLNPDFCRSDWQQPLLDFLAGCYELQPKGEMTQPLLEKYSQSLTHLFPTQLLAAAEQFVEYTEPFLQLVGAALLISLAALGHAMAEDILIRRLLPKLFSGQELASKWAYSISYSLLQRRVAKEHTDALQKLLEEMQAHPNLLTWSQALLTTTYPPYCHLACRSALSICNERLQAPEMHHRAWHIACQAIRAGGIGSAALQQLPHLLERAETHALAIDVPYLTWFSRAIKRYHRADVYRLPALWLSAIKIRPEVILDATQAGDLLTCCEERLAVQNFALNQQFIPLVEICCQPAVQRAWLTDNPSIAIKRVWDFTTTPTLLTAIQNKPMDQHVLNLWLKLAQQLTADHLEMALEAIKKIGRYEMDTASHLLWQKTLEQLRVRAKELKDDKLIEELFYLLRARQAPKEQTLDILLDGLDIASLHVHYAPEKVLKLITDIWQQVNGNKQPASISLRRERLYRSVLDLLNHLLVLNPSEDKLQISKKMLLDSACRNLLERTEWLRQMGQWLEAALLVNALLLDRMPIIVLETRLPLPQTTALACCRAFAALPAAIKHILTEEKLERLLAPFVVDEPQHSQVCHQILLYLNKSPPLPKFSRALYLEQLLSVAATANRQADTWRATIGGLEQLLVGNAEVFEDTAYLVFYIQVIQTFWLEEQKRALKWLTLLKKIITQPGVLPLAVVDHLQDLSSLWQSQKQLSSLYEWLNILKPHLQTVQQQAVWQEVFCHAADQALIAQNYPLAAQMTADSSFHAISTDRYLSWVKELPLLCKGLSEHKDKDSLLASLIAKFAHNLDVRSWQTLWQILQQVGSKEIVERAYLSWYQQQTLVRGRVVVNSSHCHSFIALVNVRSEYCLNYLTNLDQVTMLLACSNIDDLRRASLVCCLLEIALLHASELPTTAIEALYQSLLEDTVPFAKRIEYSLICLKKALESQVWWLVANMIDFHTERLAISTPEQQQAFCELLLVHWQRCPSSATKTITALLNFFGHLKSFPLKRAIFSFPKVYYWLSTLTEGLTARIEQQRDLLALTLLAEFLRATAYKSIQVYAPQTQKLLERIVGQPFFHDHVAVIIDSPCAFELIASKSSNKLAHLRSTFVEANLRASLTATCGYKIRMAALDDFIKYYASLQSLPSIKACSDASLRTLVALLCLDDKEKEFSHYYIQLLKVVWAHHLLPTGRVNATTSSCDENVAMPRAEAALSIVLHQEGRKLCATCAEYCYSLYDILSAMHSGPSLQPKLIQWMYATLQIMFNFVQKGYFPTVPPALLLEKLKTFCMHPMGFKSASNSQHAHYVQNLYTLVQQAHLFEIESLQQLQVELASGLPGKIAALYFDLNGAILLADTPAVSIHLKALIEAPYLIDCQIAVKLIIEACIYLYIEGHDATSAQCCFQLLLRQCADISAANPLLAIVPDDNASLAQGYWVFNRPLALHLMLIEQCIQNTYNVPEQQARALFWVQKFLIALADEYGPRHLALAHALGRVLAWSFSCVDEPNAAFLQTLDHPHFQLPQLSLRILLFQYLGKRDRDDLTRAIKIDILTHVIGALRRVMSWRNFYWACEIATNYQKHVYQSADPALTTWYASFVDGARELMTKLPLPPDNYSLLKLVGLIHNSTISVVNMEISKSNTLLPKTKEAHQLIHRLTDLMLMYLENALPETDIAARMQKAESLHLSQYSAAITYNIARAVDCKAYHTNKALYFSHMNRLLPFSITTFDTRSSIDQSKLKSRMLIFTYSLTLDLEDMQPTDCQQRAKVVSAWFLALSKQAEPLPTLAWQIFNTDKSIQNCYQFFKKDYLHLKQELLKTKSRKH